MMNMQYIESQCIEIRAEVVLAMPHMKKVSRFFVILSAAKESES